MNTPSPVPPPKPTLSSRDKAGLIFVVAGFAFVSLMMYISRDLAEPQSRTPSTAIVSAPSSLLVQEPANSSRDAAFRAAYDAVDVGDARSKVVAVMEREPDLIYKGYRGVTVLQFKDSQSLGVGLNILRFGIINDKVVFVSFTPTPSNGGISAASIKN